MNYVLPRFKEWLNNLLHGKSGAIILFGIAAALSLYYWLGRSYTGMALLSVVCVFFFIALCAWLYINLDSIRGKLEAKIGVLGTTALFLVIVVAILLLANKLGLLGNINLV